MQSTGMKERIRRRKIKDGCVAGLFLAGLMAVGGFTILKQHEEYKEIKTQRKKDAVIDAILIEKREGVTAQGCAGIMFFGLNGQTNHSDAIMHYVTEDPVKIEEIRQIKSGTVRKVSQWKGMFDDRYQKTHTWYDLTKQ